MRLSRTKKILHVRRTPINLLLGGHPLVLAQRRRFLLVCLHDHGLGQAIIESVRERNVLHVRRLCDLVLVAGALGWRLARLQGHVHSTRPLLGPVLAPRTIGTPGSAIVKGT